MELTSHLLVAALAGMLGMVTMGVAAYMRIYRKAMTKDDHEVICGRTQNSVSAKLALVHQKVETIEKQNEELKTDQKYVRATVDKIMAKLAVL